MELSLETILLLSLQCPCFVHKSQCDVQLSWAVLKAYSSFLGGEEGKTKGVLSCRQEEGACNTVVKAGEIARLNMIVCKAKYLSLMFCWQRKVPVFSCVRFHFLLLLSMDEKLPSVLVLQCICHPADFGCPVLKAYLVLVRCFNYMTSAHFTLHQRCSSPPAWRSIHLPWIIG